MLKGREMCLISPKSVQHIWSNTIDFNSCWRLSLYFYLQRKSNEI